MNCRVYRVSPTKNPGTDCVVDFVAPIAAAAPKTPFFYYHVGHRRSRSRVHARRAASWASPRVGLARLAAPGA